MAYNKYGFDAGKNKTPMGDSEDITRRLSNVESMLNKLFPSAQNGSLAANNLCPIAIGEVYISTKTTSPDKIWPNTRWTAVSSGRVLINWSPGSTGNNQINAETYNKYHDIYPQVEQYDLSTPKTTVGSWNTRTTLRTESLPSHAHPFSEGALHHTHDMIVDESTFFHPEIPGEGTGFPTAGMTNNHRVYSETSIPSTAWDCRNYNKTVVYYTMRVDMSGWKTNTPPFGAGLNDDGIIRPSTFDKTAGGKMQAPITTSVANIFQKDAAGTITYRRIDEEGDGWTKQDTIDMGNSMYAAAGSELKGELIISNNIQPSFVVCMWYRIA